MRRALIALACLAVVAAVVLGLSQADTDTTAPRPAAAGLADQRTALAGAPAPLAALHRQANDLLPGGADAVMARLRALRGRPVVLNKWASWCGPCRFEFPFFQRVGVRYGKRVAFLGVNSGDNSGDARRFLSRFPVPFPSYEDPNERTAVRLEVGAAYPTTIFYDADGRQAFVHQGGYAKEAQLVDDIERYALGRGS